MGLLNINGLGAQHPTDPRTDDLVHKHEEVRAWMLNITAWLNNHSSVIEDIRKAHEAAVDDLKKQINAIPPPAPATPAVFDVTYLDRAIQALSLKLKKFEEEAAMHNADKQKILDKIGTYWRDIHPDCFMDLADGRRVFSEELYRYKQDLILRTLMTPKEEKKQEPKPEPREKKMWPLWACIAVLFALEVWHLV